MIDSLDVDQGQSRSAAAGLRIRSMEQTMSLRKIRLELARTPGFPNGNPSCGYEFSAPLDSDGRLDPDEWSRLKDHCVVRRFWQQQGDEHGRLEHHRGNRWVFSYRPGDDDDEPIFRFDTHAFKVGDYVSVTEHDGVVRPFRVAAVKPIRTI
jgi:hypothetical protein